MAKAVYGREFNNVAGFRCSYGTIVQRVAIQGLVCSPRMVVIQIRRYKSLEMPFVEHDDVVKSSRRSLPITRSSPLPWRRRCRDDFVDTQTFNPPRNALAVYAIAVSNQITRSSIKWKRFDDLLRRPLRRRMLRHIEVNNSPPVVWASTMKTNNTRNVAVGTMKKSIDTRFRTCWSRNVLHVGDAGPARFG